MCGLTTKQYACLLAVAQHLAAHGKPPTVRELAEALNVSSSCTAQRQLDALIKKGFLARDVYQARSLQFTEAGWAAVAGQVAGCACCSGPLLAAVVDDQKRGWCGPCVTALLATVEWDARTNRRAA